MSGTKRHINPKYNRHAAKVYTEQECIEGLPHDRQVLSWLISKSESKDLEAESLLNNVLEAVPVAKPTQRFAISGSPGVGKSTFINSYAKHLVDNGHKVAILPVDPTSYLSKGSILGDKTRMEDLVGNSGAFIKPVASSLALGGIAPSSRVSISLCERAGFDTIFVETVGVGQSEYEVRHLVDMFMLLIQPGSGDDLQGIKRGIMEMADILVVTKADGDMNSVALQSAKNLKKAVSIFRDNSFEWLPKVHVYSSVTHAYREQLDEGIQKYFDHMSEESRLETLRHQQSTKYFDESIDDIILAAFKSRKDVSSAIEQLKEGVKNKSIMPLNAIQVFKDKIRDIDD